ncbi:MAG TPA: ABC transporter permease [Thermoplasmata archaeon]|jgi:ABC-2 type transport system permease protein|nr:ABC transporter permease [Thermoplasmata archaeon]
MNRVLADLKAFGTQYLRSRVGTFFALVFPILLILLFGAIFGSSGSSRVTLYVQDLDGTQASRAFVDALAKTNVTTIQIIPTGADFSQYIRDHSINVALQIPAGFQTALAKAQNGTKAYANLTIAGDETQTSYQVAVSVVKEVATQFNLGIANATEVVGVERTSVPGLRSLTYIDLFLPGIIGFTILSTPLFGMTAICAEYRSRRYFKLLATTKLSKAQWLASKVGFHILLLFVSVALMVLVGVLVFSMKAVVTPMALLITMAGTLEFTSLGMVLGIFVRDPETGAAIANAIGFPMMFLAGSFFPVDAMPAFLQAGARFLPLTYINEGLRATMTFGNESTALVDLIITLGFAIVFFVVAARGLSWKSR